MTDAQLPIIEAGRTQRRFWAEIWRYRELFYFLAWRDIRVRYKQTVLGIAWARLNERRFRPLPPAVDLSMFAPGPKPPGLVSAHRLEGRTVLLTVGRLASEERYKGFDEIIEALACGLPALGSILDGSREALLDGTLGVLVDPTDLDQVGSGVLEVLRRGIGHAPGFLSFYSSSNFARRLRENVLNLCAGPK